MSSRMMRAARVLSVETDTAYALRVRNFSEHFTWHCSVHPTGQQKEQCSAGFASGRSTISRYGVVATCLLLGWLSTPRLFDSGITKITVELV